LKLLGLSSLVLAVVCALAGWAVVAHYSRDLPSVAELKKGYDPPQVTRIVAQTMPTISKAARIWAPKGLGADDCPKSATDLPIFMPWDRSE
jgi:hypothetical protein